MTILNYRGKKPQLGERVWIGESAVVAGDVTLGDDASVFFGAVLRADINYVKIGKGSNVQDNATFHVSDNLGVDLGEYCVVGHNAVVHACKIGDYVTVGMGAVVMDGAEIGDFSIIGAGSLVTPGKKFPPKSLIKGSPAKFARELTDSEIEGLKKMAQKYIYVKDGYLKDQ